MVTGSFVISGKRLRGKECLLTIQECFKILDAVGLFVGSTCNMCFTKSFAPVEICRHTPVSISM